MRALFHYACSQRLSARLAALAPPWLQIQSCPESDDALLINTARGALVDQNALIDALRCGQLQAAGLDVYDEEPVRDDLPLLQMDNVVLQPHVAWLTAETLDRSLAVAVENCRRLRDGGDLLYRVL